VLVFDLSHAGLDDVGACADPDEAALVDDGKVIDRLFDHASELTRLAPTIERLARGLSD
jgi:hypothetical protein